MRIAYLTFDGIMQPLGRSQVLCYLFRLARLGHEIDIVSLERRGDVRDEERYADLVGELNDAGIRWRWATYSDGSTPADIVRNVTTAFMLLAETVVDAKVEVVHARSYLSALVARAVRLTTGTPYIFDFRGFWVDERVDDGRWFNNPLAYKGAKALERKLYEGASGIVSLTDVAAEDVRNGVVGDVEAKVPVRVIPTCADFDAFDLDVEPHSSSVVPVARELEGKLVIGYVGAINGAYCVDEGLRLFLEILDRRPDAHLLCVTRQRDEMRELLASRGIPAESSTVVSGHFQDMPQWVSLIDWGLVMRRTSFANRAAMPTKLAEFLGAGVRPIQYGCNDDVQKHVRAAGTGYVLESLDPEALAACADYVASSHADREDLEAARRVGQAYFGVEHGVEGYDALYEQLGRR